MGEGLFLDFHLEHGVHEGLESGFSLFAAYAGLQTAEGVDPSIAALREHVVRHAYKHRFCHHDRDKKVRRAARLHAVEAWPENTNNGHWIVIQNEGFAEDRGVAGEARSPIRIIQNNVGVAVGNAVIFQCEDAAQIRIDAKS